MRQGENDAKRSLDWQQYIFFAFGRGVCVVYTRGVMQRNL